MSSAFFFYCKICKSSDKFRMVKVGCIGVSSTLVRERNQHPSIPTACAPKISEVNESPIIKHSSALPPSAESVFSKNAGIGFITPSSSEIKIPFTYFSKPRKRARWIWLNPLVSIETSYLPPLFGIIFVKLLRRFPENPNLSLENEMPLPAPATTGCLFFPVCGVILCLK